MSELKLVLVHPFPRVSADVLHQTLADFRKFGDHHPAMVKVELLPSSQMGVNKYKVFEKIKLFGILPMQPVYTVEVREISRNSHIQYTSQVKSTVLLSIDLFIKEESGGLVVLEEIHLKSPVLIGKLFMRILKKMHLKTFCQMQLALQHQ